MKSLTSFRVDIELDTVVPSPVPSRTSDTGEAASQTRLYSVGERTTERGSSVTPKERPPRETTLSGAAVGQEPNVIAIHTGIPVPKESQRLVPLQTWEGYVMEVREDTLLARLTDLTSREPDLDVEISLDEIPQADRELVQPGAIFYWHISYLDRPNGQRTRTSDIRFRRLPVLREQDLIDAEAEAKRLGQLLGWD